MEQKINNPYVRNLLFKLIDGDVQCKNGLSYDIMSMASSYPSEKVW